LMPEVQGSDNGLDHGQDHYLSLVSEAATSEMTQVSDIYVITRASTRNQSGQLHSTRTQRTPLPTTVETLRSRTNRIALAQRLLQ